MSSTEQTVADAWGMGWEQLYADSVYNRLCPHGHTDNDPMVEHALLHHHVLRVDSFPNFQIALHASLSVALWQAFACRPHTRFPERVFLQLLSTLMSDFATLEWRRAGRGTRDEWRQAVTRDLSAKPYDALSEINNKKARVTAVSVTWRHLMSGESRLAVYSCLDHLHESVSPDHIFGVLNETLEPMDAFSGDAPLAARLWAYARTVIEADYRHPAVNLLVGRLNLVAVDLVPYSPPPANKRPLQSVGEVELFVVTPVARLVSTIEDMHPSRPHTHTLLPGFWPLHLRMTPEDLRSICAACGLQKNVDFQSTRAACTSRDAGGRPMGLWVGLNSNEPKHINHTLFLETHEAAAVAVVDRLSDAIEGVRRLRKAFRHALHHMHADRSRQFSQVVNSDLPPDLFIHSGFLPAYTFLLYPFVSEYVSWSALLPFPEMETAERPLTRAQTATIMVCIKVLADVFYADCGEAPAPQVFLGMEEIWGMGINHTECEALLQPLELHSNSSDLWRKVAFELTSADYVEYGMAAAVYRARSTQTSQVDVLRLAGQDNGLSTLHNAIASAIFPPEAAVRAVTGGHSKVHAPMPAPHEESDLLLQLDEHALGSAVDMHQTGSDLSPADTKERLERIRDVHAKLERVRTLKHGRHNYWLTVREAQRARRLATARYDRAAGLVVHPQSGSDSETDDMHPAKPPAFARIGPPFTSLLGERASVRRDHITHPFPSNSPDSDSDEDDPEWQRHAASQEADYDTFHLEPVSLPQHRSDLLSHGRVAAVVSSDTSETEWLAGATRARTRKAVMPVGGRFRLHKSDDLITRVVRELTRRMVDSFRSGDKGTATLVKNVMRLLPDAFRS